MSAQVEKSRAPAVSQAKVEAIRAFLRAKIPLIPLKGKIPTVTGWPGTKAGEFSESDLTSSPNLNYGVVLGNGLMVVDIDPRNFKAGDNPVTRLLDDLGLEGLPSFTVATGGGGLHIYLKVPLDFSPINELKEYKGIEFKAAGRQVVGPGSIHPDSGKPYIIAQGAIDALLDAPAALLERIKQTEAVSNGPKPKTENVVSDDPQTKARYIEYLSKIAAPSVQGEQGDRNAFIVACRGRDFGLPRESVLGLMSEIWNPKCNPPWSEEDLKAKVDHAYKYAKGELGSKDPKNDFDALIQDSVLGNKGKRYTEADLSWSKDLKGNYRKNFQNLLTYLRWPTGGLAGIFAFNSFTGRVEFVNPAPWHKGHLPPERGVSDSDLALLKGYLATKNGFEMPTGAILEAIVNVAYEREFHPVREYLDGLKGKWDGKKRMNFWLQDFLGVEDSEYTRAVGRKVLCAAVKRVYFPGCKFDHVMVLEGVEGLGKSGVCGVLGGDWFGDAPVSMHDPDTIQMMQGKWIIELAELEVSTRAESDALKAFITRRVDEGRFAYGRLNGKYPRQSIFIASKNPSADGTYLKEEGGKRRWWPVVCHPNTKNGIVDFSNFKSIRNQLWAEVVAHLAVTREELFMETEALKKTALEMAQARHSEPAWTEAIAEWLRRLPEGDLRREFVTGREVFLGAMQGMEKQFDRRSALAVAAVLFHLKWENAFRRREDRLVRGYQPTAAWKWDGAKIAPKISIDKLVQEL